MKKSIVTLGFVAFLMVFSSVEASASITPVSNNSDQIEVLNLNTMKLEDPGDVSLKPEKKTDAKPTTEPTVWDKIVDWWDKL